MNNARRNGHTRAVTMRLPVDVAARADLLKRQHGGSMTAAVVAALRLAWDMPEPDRGPPAGHWAA